MNLRAKVIVSTKKAETAEQIYSTIQCPTTSRRKKSCQCTCKATPHIVRKSPDILSRAMSVAFCVFVVNNYYFPQITFLIGCCYILCTISLAIVYVLMNPATSDLKFHLLS